MAAIELLRRHAWPGNVRELRNAVERAAVMCTESTILPEHLPPSLVAAIRAAPTRARTPAAGSSVGGRDAAPGGGGPGSVSLSGQGVRTQAGAAPQDTRTCLAAAESSTAIGWLGSRHFIGDF